MGSQEALFFSGGDYAESDSVFGGETCSVEEFRFGEDGTAGEGTEAADLEERGVADEAFDADGYDGCGG
jgi:hypothetical protein